MTEFSGRRWSPGETAYLNGNRFVDCTFVSGCHLVYQGGEFPDFQDCYFEEGIAYYFYGDSARKEEVQNVLRALRQECFESESDFRDLFGG